MRLLALAALALLFVAHVRADPVPCAGDNGSLCDDGNILTTNDTCTGGVCSGLCESPYAIENGTCVVVCPSLSVPENAKEVDCSITPNILVSFCYFFAFFDLLQSVRSHTRSAISASLRARSQLCPLLVTLPALACPLAPGADRLLFALCPIPASARRARTPPPVSKTPVLLLASAASAFLVLTAPLAQTAAVVLSQES